MKIIFIFHCIILSVAKNDRRETFFMINKKQKTLISYKKAKSLIEKIIAMIEKDEYCIDIMHQNLACMGLLKAAQQALMENHLETCFKNNMNSNNKKIKKEMLDEIVKISKYASKFSCNWSLDASCNHKNN